jgi:MOSC domain-containing protein YiiM
VTPAASGRLHECGFPAGGCSRDDLLGTLRAFTGMWRALMAGLDDGALASPEAGGGPSVFGDVDSARSAVAAARDQVRAVVDAPASTGGPPPAPPVVGGAAPDEVPPSSARADGDMPGTARAAAAVLDRAIAGLNAAAGRADAAAWAPPTAAGGNAGPVAALVGAAVHEGVHRLHAGGRLVQRLGRGTPAQLGRVVQLNVSGGGVPKTPVPGGRIGDHGLAGDRQAERRIHGRPYQALSLWSAEVIEALRAEGHGVYPGAAGENVTLAGIDWPTIRPGVRVQVGEALVEVSGYATPCGKNARWFVDGAIDRIDQRRHPGWSRAYAWVLRPGAVGPGDAALVEPPGPDGAG